MKKIVLVKPNRTRSPDGTMDKYDYPDHKNLKITLVCYNRKNNPPNGDFLCEQMWIIEGNDEDVNNFTKDSRVQVIDQSTAINLGKSFDPPREEETDISAQLMGIKIELKSTGTEIPLNNIKGTVQIRGFVETDWNFN